LREISQQWVRELINCGDDAPVATFEKMSGPISANYAARLRVAVLQSYLACVASQPSVKDMLGGMTVPCCLYAGEDDVGFFVQAKMASELIPNSRFIAFPGLAHLPAFVASRAVLPPVMKFLESRVV
jgi:pimeloyl-ACP methyl ester carboxylesterase